MHRVWLIGAPLLLLVLTGVTRMSDLGGRLSALEERDSALPANMRRLAVELEATAAELQRVRAAVAAVEQGFDTEEQELHARLGAIARDLEASEARVLLALSDQGSQIRALESIRQSLPATDLERHVREATVDADRRLQQLGSRVDESAHSVELLNGDLRRLSDSIDRDVEFLWRELVGPTVQLSGLSTVGSGVLLPSREKSQGAGFETLLVTAWHVVRDIIAESGQDRPPIPVAIHHADGLVQRETATLLENDPKLDVALLQLDSNARIEHGARLAPRERLEAVRTFERIYAVGCPLGNDPIPTPGEIAHPRHRVDGSTYWMISAPTYIGNSGGPIFDEGSHELLGIFSKIYTHGSLRPTVVPHMGLVTPLHLIYDWIEKLASVRLEPVAGAGGALTIVRVDDGSASGLARSGRPAASTASPSR